MSKNREKTEKAPKKKLDREQIKRPYTVIDCMHLGLIGNILFVSFIVICLIYYYSFGRNGHFVLPFEFLAYFVETAGFALFSLSVIWLSKLVRFRTPMKVLLLVYILIEALLMLMEFELLLPRIYNPLSKSLIILHAIFSAGVAFSMLSLDSSNEHLQHFIIITCTIMLGGMFLGLAGFRAYASVLLNAFAYIFFFTAMIQQLRLEEMDIDCYGDNARVAKFESTMFTDSPLLVEKEPPRKKNLKEKAAAIRDQIVNEEQTILTDKDEKFEYEFGVDEDDEEEDEDA